MTWCTECGEEFAEVEYRPVPVDPGDERFCSDGCEDAFHGNPFDDDGAYTEARYGAAPLWL